MGNNMTDELKPVRCGCGEEPVVGHIKKTSYLPKDRWYIGCPKCDICTGLYDTEAEVVEAWNTAVRADRCCNTCDSYEAGRYCLLWSIFCPSDHWCKDWSENE